MKKKTILGVSALAGLLLVAATGCEKTQTNPATQPTGGEKTPTQSVEYVAPNLGGRTLNIYVNYCAQTGVTWTGNLGGDSYLNPFDNQTYTQGNLLPMWKEVQTKLNCVIHDSVWDFKDDGYTKAKTTDQWTVLSDESNFADIDFLMTDSASAADMNKNGQLVNLLDYLQYMPNFEKFLTEHPTVASEMTNLNGELYMLPYFDGLDSPEKMHIMNTELVVKLLDSDSANYDTTDAKATAYEAFIDTSKDQKVQISVNGKAEEITLKAAKNPVTAQNELTTKNGKTYVEALKAYIDAAYMPSGKYAKRSEVFISEHACYTVDDMVALMRCAVNNSTYLYGSAGKVHGLIPREGKDSRIDSMLYFLCSWGVRGVNSEKEHMYFDANGKLQDARVQQATYDALGYMHDLYAEGLIIDGFEEKNGAKYNNDYLTGAKGASLLIYDYNATQAVCNAIDENGVGTKDSQYSGVMPVLPPLTYWKDDNINGTATGGKGYALTRYTEDARSNKGAGTVIPTSATKDQAQIIAACQLADYFYSVEGGQLQDFGPEAYRDGEIVIGGVAYPKFNKTVMSEINKSGLGWNNYMRVCMGTTQGFGHVRSDALDYQVTNTAGQKGLANLLNAVNSGVVTCAVTTRSAGFGSLVPSQWSSSPKDGTDTYTLITEFFKRGTGATGWREVIVKGWDEASVSQENLKALANQINTYYLAHYQTLYDNKN